jgi:N-acetylneuraminic acid mutarotase
MGSLVQRVRGVAVLAAIVAAFAPTASAQGKWVKLAPFPEPDQEISGVSTDGKLYVFGGLPGGTDATPTGLVYEYDPANDKWTKKKKMPLPAHHLAVTEYRGKIYLFGGGARLVPGGPNWVPISNSWEYDPTNDSWKALAPMPTPRGGAVAATVGDKMYVIGGGSVHPGATVVGLTPASPQRALTTNEMYDPVTNAWQTRSPMPTPRNHTAIGVVNGKIYVIGGRVASVYVLRSANVDVVEEYDPATDSWGAPKARMPIATSGVAFGTYREKIYIAGGESQNLEGLTAFRALQAYDAANDQWSILPSMPVPRNGPAGAVVGNRFLVVSGHLQSGSIGGPGLNTPDLDAFELDGQ